MGVEGLEDREKPLGVACRLEALQCPFSSPGPLMRVLSAALSR